MDEERITQKIFESDYLVNNSSDWCNEISNVLSSIKMINKFDDKMPVNIDEARELLMNKYKELWSDAVACKPKLRTYVTFKKKFEPEHYLKQTLEKLKRSLLAQFRLGFLPIAIETGRYKLTKDKVGNWRRQAPEEIICPICNLNTIENETHFLIDCVQYKDIRDEMFRKVNINDIQFKNNSSEEKLIYLMGNCNKSASDVILKA